MADGAINIDLKLKSDKFNREIKDSDKLVNEFGKNAGEKLDKAFKENTDKVLNKAKLTKKEVKALFDKDTKVKIVAEAEKAGIKDFQNVLKKLPKQQKIELFTEMKDKGTINFSKKLNNLNKELRSDIGKLKSAYENTSHVQASYLNRLKAEGRSVEANKVEYQNLRSSIKKESELYQKEHRLLTSLRSDRNEDASKIAKQTIKVNDLAASLARNTNKMKELSKTQSSFNRNPFTKMTKGLLGLNKQANKSESVFKKVFSGVFWGEVAHGAASSALNVIKTGIGGIAKAGNEFNKEQQVMNATWTTLTGSASKGEGFVKSINDMSNAFGQSNDLVNELDQQFYHVFNKKEPTERLTKSLLTMADTLGMSADDTKRLGLNFTHMMSSSKMQLGDFNMISDQLPMFGERLLDYERKMQHNNSLSMSELRKQMSAGKISAKDAEAVMNGLGEKYKDASENMMKTAAGAERAIKGRFKVLAGALVEPFTKMQSPIFEAVSKWVSDKKTEKKFAEVGKAASKGFQTITTALTKALDIKDGPKAMNKFMDGLAKSIKSVSDVIANHSKQIVGFFKGLWSSIKIIGTIGIGFFKGLIGGIGAILTPIAKLVGHNKKS